MGTGCWNCSSPLLTQATHHLPITTDVTSLWGTRDPEYPHPVVLAPLDTPHIWVTFLFRKQKLLAFNQFITDVEQPPTTTRKHPQGRAWESASQKFISDPIWHWPKESTWETHSFASSGFNASCWDWETWVTTFKRLGVQGIIWKQVSQVSQLNMYFRHACKSI